MPADDPNGRPPDGGFEGFHSYADDAPRFSEPAAEAHGGEGLRLEPHAPSAGRRIPWRPAMVAAGVVAALSVGGVLVARGPSAETAESAIETPLPVEVAEVETFKPPPVSEAAPLEVLPDLGERRTIDLAPDVPPPAPRVRAEAAARPEPEPSPRFERAEPRSPQLAVTGVPAAAAAVEPPRRDPCAGEPSLAAEMVCRDPELAAADRRMQRAYDAALASGAPEEVLALEQADWRDIREMAAQRSRRAVASIYRQRTDELRMMADEAWR